MIAAHALPDIKAALVEVWLPPPSVNQTDILVGAREFPGHLIAARRLLGADRRPATKLTRYDIGAARISATGPDPVLMESRKKLLPPSTRLVEPAASITVSVPGTPITPSPFKS